MKPRRITPQLLHTFLSISGNKLMKTYGKQADKLIHYVIAMLPEMPQESIASTTRLDLFIQETAIAQGIIPIFEGSTLEK